MSGIPKLRVAIIDLLRGLYPTDVQITYGPPTDLAERMIYIDGTRIPTNANPTRGGGARRSVDETSEIDVIFSAYVAGIANPELSEDDAQRRASDTAWAMYDELQDHFRSPSSAPLTPGARDPWITEVKEEIYPAGDDSGWICDVTATITTITRIP